MGVLLVVRPRGVPSCRHDRHGAGGASPHGGRAGLEAARRRGGASHDRVLRDTYLQEKIPRLFERRPTPRRCPPTHPPTHPPTFGSYAAVLVVVVGELAFRPLLLLLPFFVVVGGDPLFSTAVLVGQVGSRLRKYQVLPRVGVQTAPRLVCGLRLYVPAAAAVS